MKIVMLGDAGVGKTAIRNRLRMDKFSSEYTATIGVDFCKCCTAAATFEIWDTAGQERFQSLGTFFYRGADALVLVYDVCRRDSLVSLMHWLDRFLLHSDIDAHAFPVVLVGNKSDLGVAVDLEQSITASQLLKLRCLDHARRFDIQHHHNSLDNVNQDSNSDCRDHGSYLDEFRDSLPRKPPSAYTTSGRMFASLGRRSDTNSVYSFFTANSYAHGSVKDLLPKTAVGNESQETIVELDEILARQPAVFDNDQFPIFHVSAKSGNGIAELFDFIALNVTPRKRSVDLSRVNITKPTTSLKPSCC